jgi:hypothetical protein
MKDFLAAHGNKIKGVLSCFDRLIFRGYLPVANGAEMAKLINRRDIDYRTLKDFLLGNAERIKQRAVEMAGQAGRPFQHLQNRIPMEREARKIAERDQVAAGLICVFSILEPCRTFSFKFYRGDAWAKPARRKCLHLYYYFIDPDLGLIHVRIQTWFPMVMQVYVNGHEWLARKLDRHGIRYTKVGNTFIEVSDLARAQSFSDRFASLDWPKRLGRYARQVNPLLSDMLAGQSYYWCTAQSEYATDVIFKRRQTLAQLFPRLLSHGTRCFGAKEVMGFLGRKLVGQFRGEVTTSVCDFAHLRLPGMRIKHRAEQNWIKMYDKAGVVLRIETVINNPEHFRVRRTVRRRGQSKTLWVPMRKGVAFLFRYRDVSSSANGRYLDALAVVDDPTAKLAELDRVTRRHRDRAGRTARALNPLSRDDTLLFAAVMNGADCLRGFTNADVRRRLAQTPDLVRLDSDKKRSAKVSRILRRLHLHRLIAKIPRSRRWRTTRFGRRMMATSLQLRHLNFPQLLALAP